MKFRMLAAAATLAVATSSALAQDPTPIPPLELKTSSANTLTATFTRPATGIITDTFEFSPSAVSGMVSVSLMALSGPVNFYAAFLNGMDFSFFPEDGLSMVSFQAAVTADVPLTLVVLGFSGVAGDDESPTPAAGGYGGTITVQTVTAIPEPQTYALMLAGLLALGAAARRRKGLALPH